MRTITIVNQSSLVSDADFDAYVAAQQKQLDEHVAPAWGGLTAQLVKVKAAPGVPYPVAGEAVYLLDDSDQQGALGYHEDDSADAPKGYVFVKTSADAGDPWQTTASHEVIEQLIDPFVSSCAVVTKFPLGVRLVPAAIAFETCDPVENDQYAIDGVPMSNFVLPRWFQDGDTPGIAPPFDYLGKLTAPLTMTSGGYISFTRNLRNWLQTSARKAADKYARHRPKRAA